MQNPANIRRADIERAVTQHEGPKPVLYAVAQGIERNMQQTRREMVRDADPHRDPMHGGDRRETIGRVIDGLMLTKRPAMNSTWWRTLCWRRSTMRQPTPKPRSVRSSDARFAHRRSRDTGQSASVPIRSPSGRYSRAAHRAIAARAGTAARERLSLAGVAACVEEPAATPVNRNR